MRIQDNETNDHSYERIEPNTPRRNGIISCRVVTINEVINTVKETHRNSPKTGLSKVGEILSNAHGTLVNRRYEILDARLNRRGLRAQLKIDRKRRRNELFGSRHSGATPQQQSTGEELNHETESFKDDESLPPYTEKQVTE